MKIYVNHLCPQCDALINALLNELKDRPAQMAEIELVQVTNENIDVYGVTKVPTILPHPGAPVPISCPRVLLLHEGVLAPIGDMHTKEVVIESVCAAPEAPDGQLGRTTSKSAFAGAGRTARGVMMSQLTGIAQAGARAVSEQGETEDEQQSTTICSHAGGGRRCSSTIGSMHA